MLRSLPYARVATLIVMWLVRLRMGVARPCARGSQRFMMTPRPTDASLTYRSATSTLASMSTALATAERNSFSAKRAPRLGTNVRRRCAVSTSLPEIISSTWATFFGVMRTNLALATASIVLSLRLRGRAARRGRSTRRRGLLDVRAVAAEHPRRHELAQLVAHHVLRDVDGQELVAVVDRQRVADELGQDGAAPRPRLDHALLALAVHALDLLHEAVHHVRALFDRTRHEFPPGLLRPPADDEL